MTHFYRWVLLEIGIGNTSIFDLGKIQDIIMQALMIARLFIIFLMLAGKGIACSCVGPGPVWVSFSQGKIIFTGKVVAGNGTGKGDLTHYLVEVDEAFQGLASDQKEVFIDPDISPVMVSTCRQIYEPGKKYLFFATANIHPTMGSYFKRLSYIPRNLPVDWEKKLDLTVYTSMLCHGSRPLEHAESDVKWLRNAVKEKKEKVD